MSFKISLTCFIFLQFSLLPSYYVNSAYYPVRYQDISRMTFKKYEKTEGTYLKNQMNCTNEFQETCTLFEPSKITCFFKDSQWKCLAHNFSNSIKIKKVKITCEDYPFSDKGESNDYIVKDSCTINFEIIHQATIMDNITAIVIFYFVAILSAILFMVLAFKKRGRIFQNKFKHTNEFKDYTRVSTIKTFL